MQIIFREENESHIKAIVKLKDDNEYSEDALLDFVSDRSVKRYSSCVGNIAKQPGCYEVSIQIGHHPYDDIFAEMVKQYGKA